MNEQLIIKAMARAEFGKRYKGIFTCTDGIKHVGLYDPDHAEHTPYIVEANYLTSHDAVQRVVDKLSDIDLHDAMIQALPKTRMYPDFSWARATPLQKCEAILKSLGLWTKENGH